MSDFKFEMFVLVKQVDIPFGDAPSLLHGIRACSQLWKNPEIDENSLKIKDEKFSLQVVDSSYLVKTLSSQFCAFSIVLSGEYDAIEPLRIKIIEYIEGQVRVQTIKHTGSQKFENNHIYITRDDISEKIACELYPYLYRLENRLRGYLTHFMTTRFGSDWWQLSASKVMDDKVNKRKKNETVFGKLINNRSFLIDFDELGKLIFEQTSGLLTREDIQKRVMQMPEIIDALKELKSDLQSNYYKFFKKAFADRDFKKKWQEWELLRNKIAHTNLFTKSDLTRGKEIAEELIEIINDAYNAPDQPTISQVEREAIQEQIIARTPDEDPLLSGNLENDDSEAVSDSLTKEEFLNELNKQEEFYANRPNGFVGLVRFIRYHLPALGHSEVSARKILERLKGEGKIEVYYVNNPYGDDDSSQTAALRTVQ